MNLLIITAVQSFEEDVKKILKTSGIDTFSSMEVTGHKNLSGEPQDTNWFASSGGEHQSVMFYAFVDKAKVAPVLGAIKALNETQETHSHVHCGVLEASQVV